MSEEQKQPSALALRGAVTEAARPRQREGSRQPPSPEPLLSVSAAGCQTCEPTASICASSRRVLFIH